MEDRNKSFALSYAKDIVASSNLVNTLTPEKLMEVTVEIARGFMKFLEEPSTDDKIRASLAIAGIKQHPLITKAVVYKAWEDSNGDSEKFIELIEGTIAAANIITLPGNKAT